MTVSVSKAPRKLGGSSLSVFPIGLDCMSLSGAYGKGDDAESIKVVHHAIDNGVKPSEISEIITHLAFYSGWANAMSAVGVAVRAVEAL